MRWPLQSRDKPGDQSTNLSPKLRTGITTMGALGLTLIILVSLGIISGGWLIPAVLCTMAAIGQEGG